MGYSTQKITIKKDEWNKNKGIYNIYLKSDNKLIKEVKIVDSRLTKKTKRKSTYSRITGYFSNKRNSIC